MPNTEPAVPPAPRIRDVNTRGAVSVALWLGLACILVAGAMWLLMKTLDRSERAADKPLSPEVAASLLRTPPEPRLEAYPLVPRERLRAEEDAILTTYGWSDKAGGFARIPIERAMELVARRGLPPSQPMAATAPLPAPEAPK
jgi:hypothetical protein